jgi:hypothetical protein
LLGKLFLWLISRDLATTALCALLRIIVGCMIMSQRYYMREHFAVWRFGAGGYSVWIVQWLSSTCIQVEQGFCTHSKSEDFVQLCGAP